MAIDKVVAPLLRVPLFAGLKPLQITEIARQAERCPSEPGETITKAGQPGDGAFLIVRGRPSASSRLQPLAPPEPIEPGSLLGEMAMLVEHVYRTTVVAQERVLCLKIHARGAACADARRPWLCRAFPRRITDRLTPVQDELREIDGCSPRAIGTTLDARGARSPCWRSSRKCRAASLQPR